MSRFNFKVGQVTDNNCYYYRGIYTFLDYSFKEEEMPLRFFITQKDIQIFNKLFFYLLDMKETLVRLFKCKTKLRRHFILRRNMILFISTLFSFIQTSIIDSYFVKMDNNIETLFNTLDLKFADFISDKVIISKEIYESIIQIFQFCTSFMDMTSFSFDSLEKEWKQRVFKVINSIINNEGQLILRNQLDQLVLSLDYDNFYIN